MASRMARSVRVTISDLIARDLATAFHGERLAVAVRGDGVLVDAGPEAADGLAHGALRARHDLVGEGLESREPELLHELHETIAPHAASRDLSVEVAHHEVGHAHVGARSEEH